MQFISYIHSPAVTSELLQVSLIECPEYVSISIIDAATSAVVYSSVYASNKGGSVTVYDVGQIIGRVMEEKQSVCGRYRISAGDANYASGTAVQSPEFVILRCKKSIKARVSSNVAEIIATKGFLNTFRERIVGKEETAATFKVLKIDGSDLPTFNAVAAIAYEQDGVERVASSGKIAVAPANNPSTTPAVVNYEVNFASVLSSAKSNLSISSGTKAVIKNIQVMCGQRRAGLWLSDWAQGYTFSFANIYGAKERVFVPCTTTMKIKHERSVATCFGSELTYGEKTRRERLCTCPHIPTDQALGIAEALTSEDISIVMKGDDGSEYSAKVIISDLKVEVQEDESESEGITFTWSFDEPDAVIEELAKSRIFKDAFDYTFS